MSLQCFRVTEQGVQLLPVPFPSVLGHSGGADGLSGLWIPCANPPWIKWEPTGMLLVQLKFT